MGELLADARIRVDDRNINDWLVEPGREYTIEVVADGRDAYREKVRFGAAVRRRALHACSCIECGLYLSTNVVDAKGTSLCTTRKSS